MSAASNSRTAGGRDVPARAAVVALVAGLLLALVTTGALLGAPVRGWDRSIHRWVLDHRDTGIIDAARFVTELGGGSVATVVGVATAALALVRRRWGLAAFAVSASIGTQLLVQGAKDLVGRPRPGLAGQVVSAGGASFPSGHAAQALAVWFAVAIVSVSIWRSRPIAWIAFGFAGVVAFVVGLSRIALGVHWTTDVLGGWLLATTWLALLVGAGGLRSRHRDRLAATALGRAT